MPASPRIEKILGLLLPPACREHVLGDLRERYQTPRQYLIEAISVLAPVIVSRIRRTTDFQVSLMETLSLYLSFLTSALYLGQKAFLYEHAGFARLAVPTTVSLAALLICNAYSDPERKSIVKPVLQSAGSVSLGFLGQTILFDTRPSLAVPFTVMLYGSIAGSLMITTLRVLFPPLQNRPGVAFLELPQSRHPNPVPGKLPFQQFRRTANALQSGPKFKTVIAILAVFLAGILFLHLLISCFHLNS